MKIWDNTNLKPFMYHLPYNNIKYVINLLTEALYWILFW